MTSLTDLWTISELLFFNSKKHYSGKTNASIKFNVKFDYV